MSLSLEKGSSFNLVKEDNTVLRKLRVELEWNPSQTTGSDFDLDVMAACTNDALKAVSNDNVCFFNQKVTPAIRVSEDNRTGNGDGADEILWIDLEKVPAQATKIPVLVTIYDAAGRGQSFKQVDGTKITIFNDETNQVLGTGSIQASASDTDISLLFAVVERDGDKFKYVQENQLFDKSLQDWFGVLSN